MGRIVSQTFVSLDGVTQAPGAVEEDQRDGFTNGGWVPPFVDQAFLQNAEATFRRASGFILGRRTYEQFAFWWPQRPIDGDPVSAALNTLPKYVASRTLAPAALTWHNSHLLEGDTAAAVERVKQQTDGELIVAGSVDFLQTLMRHNLVDEYQFVVFPVVVGPGHRLFRQALPFHLRLVANTITSTGVAIMTYEPVR